MEGFIQACEISNMYSSDTPDHNLTTASLSTIDEVEMELGEKNRPVIVVIGLAFVLGILMCIFTTATFADETAKTKSSIEENAAKTSEKASVPEWKPPVAPNIVIPSPVDEEQAKQIATKWGVKLISLNLTAAGYMIDFRFHVLDEKKASIFFDHRIKPYLLVERSNAKLPVPMATKVGALRTTNRGKNIKPNKNYYMIFGNPDRHVKIGDKVTLVIGDFKAEHISMVSGY